MPSTASSSLPAVPVARRVSGFTYAIRNIVAEAKKVEAAGRTVRYLNIGGPIPFGFKTPPHLIDAVVKALRDGPNGYTAAVGVVPAREAVAAEYDRRGMPIGVDRIVITSGTSEGIELALGAMAGMAAWLRGSRPALDLAQWCACAASTVTVRVIESRRPSRPGARLRAVTPDEDDSLVLGGAQPADR